MKSPGTQSDHPSLEHKLLRHLLRGGSVAQFAGDLGLGLDELGGCVELNAVTQRAGALRELEEYGEQFALARHRARAIDCLGKMVTLGTARESLRRACHDLLVPPPPKPGKHAHRLLAARDWLEQTLAPKPLPARQVIDLADRQGIAAATLRRAKRHARIVTIREGFGPGARFIWHLPGPVNGR